MKKIFSFILISISLINLLVNNSTGLVKARTNQAKVTVTTTFLADIVERLAPDTFDLVSIVPAGGDPHTYSATVADLANITQADVVLYHGLHFEAQLADVLATLDNTHSVTETFDRERLLTVEDESSIVDPHYWFDIDLYKQSVNQVESILLNEFPEYSQMIEENTHQYQAELDELKQWVEEKVSSLPEEGRILVTPHDAFSYFARYNNFTVYAPQGISTVSEVSNDAIIKTVQFIIDHNVPAIFLDTTSNPQAMKKLQEGVENLGSVIDVIGGEGQELYSDSLAAHGHDNDNYIDMYKHNVSVIVYNLIPQNN